MDEGRWISTRIYNVRNSAKYVSSFRLLNYGNLNMVD